jgi:transposase
MFRDLMPLLADNCHLIAPDYPGFGNSSAPGITEFEYTFDHLAQVIQDFTDALGLQRFTLSGLHYAKRLEEWKGRGYLIEIVYIRLASPQLALSRIASRVRQRCVFAGSLRAGQRAANVMSLIRSAKLNGHGPYLYLKDVLERLPTQPARRIEELLPHQWQPTPTTR